MKILKRIFENSISNDDFINKLSVAGYSLKNNELLDVFNNNKGYISFSKELEFFNWLSKEEWIKQQQEAREKAQNAYYKVGADCRPSDWMLKQKGLDEWDRAGFLSYTIEGQTEKAVKVKIFNRKVDKTITEWFPKTQITVAEGASIQRGINAKIDRAIAQVNEIRTSIAQMATEKNTLESTFKSVKVTKVDIKKAQDILGRPQHQKAPQMDINWANRKLEQAKEAEVISKKIAKIESEIAKKERDAERLEQVLKNI